jgi:hypothetical protein
MNAELQAKLIAIEPKDIQSVECITSRDDEGVDYEIRVTLKSLMAHEEGEGQLGLWNELPGGKMAVV